MNIKEQFKKIKPFLTKMAEIAKEPRSDLFLVFIVVFTAIAAFGLGRLSVILDQKPSILLKNAPILGDFSPKEESILPSENAANGPILSPEGAYLASKNGTKYYLPWCATAERIKEENRVWFGSREEAERAGYQPAANCKGMQ